MRKNIPPTMVTMRLASEDVERASRLAQVHQCSRAAVIRQSIRSGLNVLERVAPPEQPAREVAK